MEAQSRVFEHTNAMPAPTWHVLKMNDACVEICDGLEANAVINVVVDEGVLAEFGAFDDALTRAQRAWEESHPAPTPQQLAERAALLQEEADVTYGGTARSPYQETADSIEESRSLAASFGHGVSDEAGFFVREAASRRLSIVAGPRQTVDALVEVTAVPGALSAAAVDVVAAEGAHVDLSVVVASGEGDANPSQAGVAATSLRVFADAGAHVTVTRTQTLDDESQDVDDMDLFAADNARIDVRQTVLGASRTNTGLTGDLRGDGSSVEVKTHYLGRDTQNHDFNYVLRHHGKKTTCELAAEGVLANQSAKTLRGTIDLVRGCKGSEGSETETVLLVDEGVRNKSVPVILCNEDDVAGNHGATIGHIRDEQLFYLTSRGLDPQEAERMFVSAFVERAVIEAPDEASQRAVLDFGERLSCGFASLFESEA